MHDQLLQRTTPSTTAVENFTIGRCDHCGALLAPEASACSSCRCTEISRVPSTGNGSIVSWTVIEISRSRTCTDFAPYTIAIVALDEGPWTYAWIEEAIPAQPGKVRVSFDRTVPGEPYPLFSVR